ncbi:outer envelope membrane protein 7-like [Neltuma alba]|uniref:outer envelope membrane protein 7-like n=1 Tax=Neltuma alba TaxID=207710 RepID=UPI0010A3F276|nr:outer envelope membrane protein 7-like [Prosopis alba]
MGKKGGSGAKQALVVVGGLACVWLAIEIALKPFLQQSRAAIDKSDSNRDPDDEAPPSGGDAAAPSPAGDATA